ncbi:MAG: hypothetical protein ACLU8W_04625 [Clostridia bacterium]
MKKNRDGVPYEGLCGFRAAYDAKQLRRIYRLSPESFFAPASVGNAALSVPLYRLTVRKNPGRR